MSRFQYQVLAAIWILTWTLLLWLAIPTHAVAGDLIVVESRYAKTRNIPLWDGRTGEWKRVVAYLKAINVACGDVLVLSTAFIVSSRHSGFQFPAFSAAQIVVYPQDPRLSRIGERPVVAANGEDLSPESPYLKHSITGIYQAKKEFRAWVTVLTWASSAMAGPGDSLYLVPSYGQLQIVRMRGEGC